MPQKYFFNYNTIIQNFEFQIDEIQKEYDSLNKKLKDGFVKVTQNLNSSLDDLKSKYENEHEALLKKLELLKAEVYRYRFIMEDGTTKFGKLTPEIDSRIKQLEKAIYEHIDLKITAHELQYNEKKEKITRQSEIQLDEIKVKTEILEDEYFSKLKNHTNTFIEKNNKELSSTKGTTDINSILGFVQCNFSNTSQFINIGSFDKKIEFNKKTIKYSYPDVVSFIDSKNLVIIYDSHTQEKSEDITDSIIFRIISSHLPDKLKLHIYDFKGMAKKFSEFLSLPKDILLTGWNEFSFSEDVSNMEDKVRENLSLIWSNIDTNTQSVHDYNIGRITNDEYDQVIPYHLYVVDNFQEVLKNQNLNKYLDQIENLTNYGTNFILMLQLEDFKNENLNDFLNRIQNNVFHLIDLTGNFQKTDYSNELFKTFNLPNAQKKQIVESFYIELNNSKENRNKLRYLDFIQNDSTDWFKNRASGELKIPIGRAKNGDDIEHLYFKTKDVLAHALLCGGVGSGKTNFLRSVITSISILYSPKEVEMYLIDLKNGAGFSVFEQSKLPHAKLFAFSAENELINDVFGKLIVEMESRYTEYAKYNIDNLDDVYKNPSLSESAPKRIVVIIDEFASVFSGGGNYQDEIASNINILAAKGRAMGINLFLSTQDFSVIRNSVFDKAKAQMATRIVLKSSPEGAMSILGTNNQGYRDVTNVGEGFINTNYGEVSADLGNKFFKSFLLETNDILPLLASINNKVKVDKLPQQESIFIDSAKEAVFESNKIMFDWPSHHKSAVISRKGIPCWLGESYLLNNNEHCNLNWKINGKSYNQNILISGSGNDRDLTVKTSLSIFSSLTYVIPDAEFGVVYLSAFDEEQSAELGITDLVEKVTNYSFELMNVTQLEELLNKLTQLIEHRKTNNDRIPQFIFIAGLEKLEKLHKIGYEPTSLGALFINLLSTANNYNIYFVCEVSKPTNLEKIGRDIIGNFEHRIAYYMNPEDSDFMINTNAASNIEKPSNQSIAVQAIYYSQSEQQSLKFKPYRDILESDKFIHNNKTSVTGKYALPELMDNLETASKEAEIEEENPFSKYDISQLGDDIIIDMDEFKTE
jgi:hypothetical protein